MTFRLNKTAVVSMAAGAILLAGLLAGGGYLLGARKPAVPKVEAPKPVPPPPVVTTTTTIAPPPVSEPLAVRAAVFDAEADAKALAQQLGGTVVPITTTSGITLYTVQIGPYPTREAAVAAAVSLADERGLKPAVIPAAAGPVKAQ